MALSNNVVSSYFDVPYEVITTRGRLLQTEHVVGDYALSASNLLDFEDELKKRLAYELVDFMIRQKLILFTKSSSGRDWGVETRYTARGAMFDANYVDELRRTLK
jgi:hypothetical protein